MFSSEPISFDLLELWLLDRQLAARPIRPSPLIATLLGICSFVRPRFGRHQQIPLGGELGGEGRVAGETEDLELAVGLARSPPSADDTGRTHQNRMTPDDGGAVAQRLPLGLVLLVRSPSAASRRSTSAEPSISAISSSNSMRNTSRGTVPSTSSATAAMKWYLPQRGQRRFDHGDDLHLVGFSQ